MQLWKDLKIKPVHVKFGLSLSDFAYRYFLGVACIVFHEQYSCYSYSLQWELRMPKVKQQLYPLLGYQLATEVNVTLSLLVSI